MFVRYAAKVEGYTFLAHEDGYIIGEHLPMRVGYLQHVPHDAWKLEDDGRDPVPGFWFPWKVRRTRPTEDDHIYLVTEDKARRLAAYGQISDQATHVGPNLVVIVTSRPIKTAIWGGKVTDAKIEARAYGYEVA